MLSHCVGYWGRRAIAPLALGFLAVGCVPYAVHQQTKEQLIQAKDANADLIKKYNTAVQQLMALRDKAPGGMPADYQKLLQEVEELRRQAANKLQPGFSQADADKLGVDREGDGIAIGEALLFSEGSADLKREASPLLDRLVLLLTKEHASEPFIIEGHTDNQPLQKTRDKFGDNLTLGYARAHAVGSYLMSKGIPESRMVAATYSFNKPINPESVSTKAGRQQNRRVVVRLTTLSL